MDAVCLTSNVVVIVNELKMLKIYITWMYYTIWCAGDRTNRNLLEDSIRDDVG